ncbi:osmotically inducible protein OsmC [Methanoculleus taiwanensis]|uniref:Osmotically inducible protein OsmC n=2 Tax=Methanoculleus taiwanensis TaxID=1550565 RepID=A0A498GYZ1_9EURY|nr:osmotically inducible protein OsmC [Methanoculleus taiwanensis]
MERVRMTVNALRKNPGEGLLTLSGVTDWNEGAHSTGLFRNFVIAADETEDVGGTNRGPNPPELVLAALGACITVGIAYSAAEDGVELRSIELDVEGDIDLKGFFKRDLNADVRPGFQAIRVTVWVDADAPPGKVAEIVRRGGEERSPVTDMLVNPVPVTVRLEQKVPAKR